MKGILEKGKKQVIVMPGLPAATMPAENVRSERLLSLDALRGFDMFWIVCGEGIFHGIASVIKQKYALQQSTVDWQINLTDNVTPVERFFVHLSNQLHHSVWNGFTFYDLIFPLFIFISGVSMPFSYRKYFSENDIRKRQELKKQIYFALIKRTVLLLFLGMVVNGLLQGKGYEETRFASVLGRIALSCFFAALIYLHTTLRKQLLWFIGLLAGYWALMMLVPVPGFGAGSLTPEGNVAAYTDRLFLPGKLHRVVYDPEGFFSTIPAIATALLGVFAGKFLLWQSEAWSRMHKTVTLVAASAVLFFCGLVWNMFFPINKIMWTSSFVLYAGGWSVLLLAIFYGMIDVAGLKTWCQPFVWMGRNSIFIYLAAHGFINFMSTSEFLFSGIFKIIADEWHPVLLWTGVALVQFSLLYFLDKKKWYLKV